MNLLRLLTSLLACAPIISAAQDSFKGKVACVKETTWFVISDKVSLKESPVYNERVRTWNRNKQLLTSKEIRHHIVGVNDSGWTGEENCIYNKDNQLLERTFYNAQMHSHTARKYDNNGRLVEESGQAKHWNADSVWGRDEFIYNEDGKKIEVRGVSNDHTYPSSIKYYSGSERMDSVISFKKDNSVAGRTLVKYDASGREIERRLLGENGEGHSWTYRYNKKGQKIEENSWEHVVYKYDDKGNEVEVLKHNDDGKLRESVANTYNDKGCLSKVMTVDYNNRHEVEISHEEEYTSFDKEGNPLKKTERWMNNGKLKTFVTVYEIRYYNQIKD